MRARDTTGYRGLLAAQLRIDEGVREKPYLDSVNKITVGVGRNLSDNGLRHDEIAYLLNNDISQARGDARALIKSFDRLSKNRKVAILNFVFNLGRTRAATFKKFIAAIEAKDWESAADELTDSLWAQQVGERAVRISKHVRDG